MIKNCSISMLILNLAGCNLFTVQSSKYLSKNLSTFSLFKILEC